MTARALGFRRGGRPSAWCRAHADRVAPVHVVPRGDVAPRPPGRQPYAGLGRATVSLTELAGRSRAHSPARCRKGPAQMSARSGRGPRGRPVTLLVIRPRSTQRGHGRPSGGTVDPAGARSTQRGRSVRAWCPLLLRRRRLRSAKSRTRLDPGRVAGVEVQRRFPSRGGGEPGPTTAAPVGRWWYSNDEAACPGVTPCSGDSADIGAGTHPRLPPTGPGRERRPRYRRRNAPVPVQKAVAAAEADPERSRTGPEHSRTCRRPPPPDPEGTRARAGRRAGRRTVRSTDRSPRPARR